MREDWGVGNASGKRLCCIYICTKGGCSSPSECCYSRRWGYRWDKLAGRIRVADRVSVGVRIGGIDTAHQPDRITFRIATERLVIVSEPVLMQACLPIEDLSREAQVVGNLLPVRRDLLVKAVHDAFR
jgi:hypothetical protein